ncbi:MAG: hypothetical protein V3W11_00590 [bacterium]
MAALRNVNGHLAPGGRVEGICSDFAGTPFKAGDGRAVFTFK